MKANGYGMKLSECKFGILVENEFDIRVGMIIGITQYTTEQGTFPVPLIQWQDGTTHAMNPDHLRLYED
jgi:hypothetical protein